jgi:transposase
MAKTRGTRRTKRTRKTAPKRASVRSASSSTRTYSGTTREVVEGLIDDGDKDGVLSVVARLELEIKKLQHDLATLKNGKGRHSEGVTQSQLALLFDELAALRNAATEPEQAEAVQGGTDDTLAKVASLDEELKRNARKPRRPPSRPDRRPLPASLQRVDNPLPVPEAECTCPRCAAPMESLKPEIHEVLDYEPGRLFVRRDIREVRVCRNEDCAIVRGPLGDKVVPGGAYGSALIAKIVVKKYRDGTSLHRIAEWMQRMGFAMASSSLSDQILWAADLLTPVWRALLDEVTRAGVMQLDGTGMPVHHKEKGKAQQTRVGTLWGVVGDARAVAYTYSSTAHMNGQRTQDIGPADVLAMRKAGFVVADADNKFDASFAREELIECGCAMHSRRYFVKALDAGNKRAAYPLMAFKKLYLLERKFADDGLSGDDLAKARQERAGPVWEGLQAWCTSVRDQEPPRSSLAVAARYLLRNYDALTRYLGDGRIPIDNGLTERLFRRIAIVRRNALFVGSHDGGRRAAVLFSIFGTCELLGINPAAYVADVLPRLARGISIAQDLPALMPAAWIDAHAGARVPALNVRRVTEFADDARH